MKKRIKGIKLFKRQEEIFYQIIHSNKRFIALNASRQFSKSTILENIIMYKTLNFPNTKCLYVTPTYSLSKIVMSKLYNNLSTAGVIKTFNKTDSQIQFINNSEIYFRSATNPDNIRGLSVHYIFVDEAAFMDDNVWNVVRPTMNVIGKQCIMASTPRGKIGFFHQAYMLGQGTNLNYESIFGHYSQNPYYNKQEVEDAQLTLPEQVFLQEYEAQFLEGGGSVFRNILNCATLEYYKQVKDGPFAIGVDLGRQSDWTVVTVINSKQEVVEIYRDNKKDWSTIIQAVTNIIKKYPNPSVYVETNGIGDVVYDLLKKSCTQIRPFITTNESKNEIIEELILAFQTQSITIPSSRLNPTLHQELTCYTFEYSPRTRRVLYSAMKGFHDDMVMSLALALKAKNKGGKITFKVI